MKDKFLTIAKATQKTAVKSKDLVVKVNKNLPTGRANEIRLSATGGVVGAVGGATLIGGMGLALLGTAIAVSGAAAVGVAGVAIGNKIGSEIDRRKMNKIKKIDNDEAK